MMDLDDIDDRSAYSLSSEGECSSSDEEQESPEHPGAELRIEGDFKCATSFLHPQPLLTSSLSSRLVQNIRLADDSSTVGVLGREWDLNIGEQEVEFRDDLRAASGIGKRRRKVWFYHRP
jgi:general transcription factor 3C polypeptide 3 (transcription factor C subunit 4)